MLQPVKKITIPNSIIEQLIKYIQDELKPGDKLPSEREMISFLGVGRTSLREALRALEGMGVVETKAGEGTYVSTDSNRIYRKPLELGVFDNKRSVKEIFDARCIVEIGMMKLVVPQIANKKIKECRAIIEELESLNVDGFETFLDLDYQFHKILAEASGNGVIIEFLNLTHRIIDEERSHAFVNKKRLKKSVEVHNDILNAIADGDVEASAKAVEKHMNWTKELLELS